MKDFALKVTVVFAILLAAAALWQVRTIVALVLVSFAITAAMRAPIAYLIGHGMRRWLAMLFVYGVSIGGLVALFFLLSFPLTGEFTQLSENIITAYTRIENGRHVFGRLDALLADRLPTVEQLAALLTGDQMPVIGQALLDITQNIGAIVGQFLLAMVLSIYWTADQVRFERFWLSLFPANQRAYARDLWHTLEAQVGAYLRSEVVQSVLAGILLVPGFWLLGVDYPVIWALLISVAWLIPLVGGLIFLIPLWITVWMGEGVWLATAASLYALAILAVMEFFVERRLYTQTRYSHVLVILVMLMLVSAYGIVGLLLAPLLATTIEVLVAKLGEIASRSPVQDIPDIDVSLLQSRLDETRQLVSTLDTPSTLRLASIADRLDDLLKQTEKF
jgi:putative permease